MTEDDDGVLVMKHGPDGWQARPEFTVPPPPKMEKEFMAVNMKHSKKELVEMVWREMHKCKDLRKNMERFLDTVSQAEQAQSRAEYQLKCIQEDRLDPAMERVELLRSTALAMIDIMSGEHE